MGNLVRMAAELVNKNSEPRQCDVYSCQESGKGLGFDQFAHKPIILFRYLVLLAR